jgi:PAS domain S-box-containing protein
MGRMTQKEATLSEQILRGRNQALQELARGAPLLEVLETLTKSTEECFPDLRCSILLLDGQRLRHGAAPSLPDFYIRAVDGLQIGPTLGSCGAAAALGTRVIVEDVLTHPNWEPFRELTRLAEFRACWSEPIFATTGEVLGTFALYYAEPRRPRASELDFIFTTAHLAGIAIERWRGEDRRRAQEERFRQLAESISEVFYLTEWDDAAPVKRVLYVSPAYETIWGRTCQSLYDDPRSWSHDIHPEDRARMVSAFLEGATRGTYDVEYRLLRSDGSTRWIHDRAFPIRDRSAQVYRIAGISEDVTRTKEIELSLRASEENFRQLAENIRGVLWLIDWTDRRLLYVSPAWEMLWSSPRPTAFGGPRRLPDTVFPEDRTRVLENFEREAESGRYDLDFRVVHPDGSVRWLHERAFPIRDGDGRVVRMAGIAEDVTERKHVEQELRRARDQNEALRREQVESLASELLLAEEHERRRLALDLHDGLNQTLTLALMKLDALRRKGAEGEAIAEIVSLVDQANQSCRSLTFQLSPPILHDLGFEPALQWLVEDVARSYGLCVSLEVPPDPSPLSERIRVLLYRAVRELLINVAKHAGASRTRVALRRDGAVLRITVEDDGQAFDPRIVGSRGLGLTAIRERLSHLGGDMDIVSSAGRGTRVSLVAPLATAGVRP